MKKGVIYIHGKGGSAEEATHYKPLFAGYEVIGLEYQSQTPWQAKEELRHSFSDFCAEHQEVIIIANSIGAFLAMYALKDEKIAEAYFISPIVDMEKLINDMMSWANISMEKLQQEGTIKTLFGETLSWEYLTWIKTHPIIWKIPTHILYGDKDNLQSVETIKAFADKNGADVTIMKDGEHWFHTGEQMQFLDNWIKSKQNK